MMYTYKILSELLSYPREKISETSHYRHVFALENGPHTEGFSSFCDWYDKQELLALQETYVSTFDLNRRINLNLFEYIHGQSPERGAAMADLIETYSKSGFILMDEMPDNLAVILEYAGVCDHIGPLMPWVLTALDGLTGQLDNAGSPYARLTEAARLLLSQHAVIQENHAGGF